MPVFDRSIVKYFAFDLSLNYTRIIQWKTFVLASVTHTALNNKLGCRRETARRSESFENHKL